MCLAFFIPIFIGLWTIIHMQSTLISALLYQEKSSSVEQYANGIPTVFHDFYSKRKSETYNWLDLYTYIYICDD